MIKFQLFDVMFLGAKNIKGVSGLGKKYDFWKATFSTNDGIVFETDVDSETVSRLVLRNSYTITFQVLVRKIGFGLKVVQVEK